MTTALLELLRNAHDVKLVVDGLPIALTIGQQPEGNSSPKADLARPNQFRLETCTWQIRFNQRELTRRNSVGLRHIHALLRRPHLFISAEELWIGTTGENVGGKSDKDFAAEGYKEVGLSVQSSHAEPLVTDETRRRLLIALNDMKEDLALLQANGDGDLGFEKEQEIEKLQEYLNEASFRGHQRRFSDPSEKARKRISVAIARAIADLEMEHPALARHLDNSIHTGKDCRYAPEAEVKWNL